VEGLRFLGCGFGQGYFFSPPVPAAEFARLLARSASGHTPVRSDRIVTKATA
jgi:EAL domain-containing protein (putative c-di-GMP-specific phosphodiesterase class I)